MENLSLEIKNRGKNQIQKSFIFKSPIICIDLINNKPDPKQEKQRVKTKT